MIITMFALNQCFCTLYYDLKSKLNLQQVYPNPLMKFYSILNYIRNKSHTT